MSLRDYHGFHAEPAKAPRARKHQTEKIPRHEANEDLKKRFVAKVHQGVTDWFDRAH